MASKSKSKAISLDASSKDKSAMGKLFGKTESPTMKGSANNWFADLANAYAWGRDLGKQNESDKWQKEIDKEVGNTLGGETKTVGDLFGGVQDPNKPNFSGASTAFDGAGNQQPYYKQGIGGQYDVTPTQQAVTTTTTPPPVVQTTTQPQPAYKFSPTTSEGIDWNSIDDPTKQGTLGLIDYSRNNFKYDPTITSAYRSPEYNASPDVNGAENSYHTYGKAVDMDVSGMSDEQRNAFIEKAKGSGFGEVLYHDAGSGNHLHLGNYTAPAPEQTTTVVPQQPVTKTTMVDKLGITSNPVAQADYRTSAYNPAMGTVDKDASLKGMLAGTDTSLTTHEKPVGMENFNANAFVAKMVQKGIPASMAIQAVSEIFDPLQSRDKEARLDGAMKILVDPNSSEQQKAQATQAIAVLTKNPRLDADWKYEDKSRALGLTKTQGEIDKNTADVAYTNAKATSIPLENDLTVAKTDYTKAQTVGQNQSNVWHSTNGYGGKNGTAGTVADLPHSVKSLDDFKVKLTDYGEEKDASKKMAKRIELANASASLALTNYDKDPKQGIQAIVNMYKDIPDKSAMDEAIKRYVDRSSGVLRKDNLEYYLDYANGRSGFLPTEGDVQAPAKETSGVGLRGGGETETVAPTPNKSGVQIDPDTGYQVGSILNKDHEDEKAGYNTSLGTAFGNLFRGNR